MTKQEFFNFHQECLVKMQAITQAKNADYTGDSVSPFANFIRVEQLGVCTTEQGFLTRMTDKLSRLASLVGKATPQVTDEKVEDTLLDLANYCILLAGFLKTKTPPTQSPTFAPTLAARLSPKARDDGQFVYDWLQGGELQEAQRRNDFIAP